MLPDSSSYWKHVFLSVLRLLFLSILFLLNSVSFAQTESSNQVRHCTPKEHAKCIRITAKEVFADGRKGEWSHHWKRMSYIGEVCVKEHGQKKGKLLEAVFAPGHYFAMFWVNVAGLATYGFTGKEKRKQLKETTEDTI